MAGKKQSANDFIFTNLIGEGAFAQVIQWMNHFLFFHLNSLFYFILFCFIQVFVAQEIATKREVAIKVCEKRHIQKEKKAQAIMREKKIMKILNDYPSPYFIKLWATFQDENRLCNIIIHVNHIIH